MQAKLEASPPATVADLLKTTGMALLTSIGGASGVIFGTLFRGGARNLTGVTVFNSETLSLHADRWPRGSSGARQGQPR